MNNEQLLKDQIAALEKLILIQKQTIEALEKRSYTNYPQWQIYPYYGTWGNTQSGTLTVTNTSGNLDFTNTGVTNGLFQVIK